MSMKLMYKSKEELQGMGFSAEEADMVYKELSELSAERYKLQHEIDMYKDAIANIFLKTFKNK